MSDTSGRATSRDQPMPGASAADAAGHDEQLRSIIASALARRAAGEAVDDAAIIAAHSHLMPRLGEQLAALSRLHRAATEAATATAGSGEPPVHALSFEELDRPIDVGEDHDMPADCDSIDEHDKGATEPERVLPLDIPGYRLLEEISAGGQAVLFKAIHETDGSVVAVKVLIGGPWVGRTARARFEREAQSLAALDHPNIAKLVGRGRTPEGAFYLVTRFIDGVGLDEWAAGDSGASPPNLDAILDVFLKIAAAVQAAHARGIVHRDLKPSNILVDRAGEPHLLDFGLARPLRDRQADPAIDRPDHTVTFTGNVIGSLQWSSPEQASGGSRDVGPASDVYSMGVILYELLAGAPPYPTAGSIVQTIENIRMTAPRLFTEIPNRRFGPISDGLQRIIFKALEKNPSRRYATAGEMAADIRRHRDGGEVYARRLNLRKPIPWPRLAAAAVALLVLAGYFAYPRIRPQPVIVIDLPRRTNYAGMEMVLVPTGAYQPGMPKLESGQSASSRPRAIHVDRRFWVGTTEVTVGQYLQVMGRLPASSPTASQMPVAGVSWLDAVEFCRLLSQREGVRYRLPTEAEWEYLCRAGTDAPIAGTGWLDQMGWYRDNSGGTVHPAGRKSPNHWGIFDTHGNLAEWCLWGGRLAASRPGDLDRLDETASRAPAPAKALAPLHGGSFNSPSAACALGGRSLLNVDRGSAESGFRVVADESPNDLPAASGPGDGQ